MPYGRREAALAGLDSVFADMQAKDEQRKARALAQQQGDKEIQARLLASLMQNPSAQNYELARRYGLTLPDYQMSPEQAAAAAIARRQADLAGVDLDPFQRQYAATTLITDKVPNKEFTETTAARNYMKPDTFAGYANEGFVPESVVGKNKSETDKNASEASFNRGPRSEQARASASASRANAGESAAHAGLYRVQANRENNFASMIAPTSATSAATNGEQPSPIVKMLLEYRYDPALLRRMKAEEQAAIAAEAQRFDPTFDMSQYEVRKRGRMAFTSGKSGDNLQSLNTAVNHIASLDASFKALNNRSFQPWNAAANYLGEKFGEGSVTSADMSINASVGELAAAFKGGTATDQEIEAWRGPINRNLSKGQQGEAIRKGAELLAGRIRSARDRYEAMMGKPYEMPILSSHSRSTLKRLGIDPNTVDPPPGNESADVGGKSLDNETAAKFLQQAGGDKNKARELARAAGYAF